MRKHSIPILGSIVLLAIVSCRIPRAEAQATDGNTNDDQANNDGNDVTDPINRFGVRSQYTDHRDAVTPAGVLDNRFYYSETFRTDLILFKKPDNLALRLDLPLAWNNAPTRGNPDGNTVSGLGDILAQADYVHAFNARWAAAFGMRTFLPTATSRGLGAGKWQLGPGISGRAMLPELSAGSFTSLTLRQFVSAAGDSERRTVQYFVIQPALNIGLPNGWFLNSTPVIRYNELSDKWFVPLDVIVGRKFGQRWVVSVEYSYGLVRDDFRYEHYVDLQVGYFF